VCGGLNREDGASSPVWVPRCQGKKKKTGGGPGPND